MAETPLLSLQRPHRMGALRLRGARVHFLKSFSAQLELFLAHYGGWGLFALNFLDSSFLAFPVVNDLLLLHLAGQHPQSGLGYALQATAGSTLGAYVIYEIPRRGRRFLRRGPPPEARIGRTGTWLQRNDFLTVLVASLLPPPTPFKLVPIAAGALRVKPVRFVAALLLGRGLRFLTESWVGMRYGADAEAFLKRNIGWASWAAAALIVAGALVYRRLRTAMTSDQRRPGFGT